jgi:hypothetical protein
MKLPTNKVFTIELCKEDAQRILGALVDYKVNCYKMIDECEDEQCKEVSWLEWSYVSELLYELEHIFDVEMW